MTLTGRVRSITPLKQQQQLQQRRNETRRVSERWREIYATWWMSCGTRSTAVKSARYFVKDWERKGGREDELWQHTSAAARREKTSRQEQAEEQSFVIIICPGEGKMDRLFLLHLLLLLLNSLGVCLHSFKHTQPTVSLSLYLYFYKYIYNCIAHTHTHEKEREREKTCSSPPPPPNLVFELGRAFVVVGSGGVVSCRESVSWGWWILRFNELIIGSMHR